MSFTRYERYKDSGVGWLGDVPEHWKLLRLKRLFRVTGGSTPAPDETFWDGDIIWVTPADLSKRNDRFIASSERRITFAGLASCSSTLVPAGSIVLSTRAPIGSLAIAEVQLCTNQGCKSLVPGPRTNSGFYAYLLGSIVDELQISGKGTTFLEISGDALGAVEVPNPSETEQEIISSFLDRETAKIGALIEEQRRLIELLKEKRQAVISHAVTKGLNPAAPMKRSGIGWLGTIPNHWNTVPMGYLVQFYSGGTPDKSNLAFWEGPIPWISPKDMKTEELTDAQDHISELALSESRLLLFQPGHLFIVVRGMILAHTFPVARNLVAVTINQDMKALRCGLNLQPDFLLLTLIGLNKLIVSYAEESAHGTLKLDSSMLSNLPIPLPPVSEQQEIIRELRRENRRLDHLIAAACDGIALLDERRAALISAAVTGKIDVRHWAPTEATA